MIFVQIRKILLLGLSIICIYTAKANILAPVRDCCEPKNWYVVDTFSVGVRQHMDFSNPDKGMLIPSILYFRPVIGNSLALGHFFRPFRVEIEASYRQGYVQEQRQESFVALTMPPSVKFGNLSFMVNGYWDVSVCNCLTLYFGAGLGSSLFYGPTVIFTGGDKPSSVKYRHRDTLFAWQFLTGITAPITDCLDLVFGYRFFSSTKPKFAKLEAGDIRIFLKQNNVPIMQMLEIGLRFKF